MATQVQLRRGTAAENNAFTGAQGEVTVDTTNDTLRVHDGSQAGGYEVITADASGNVGIGTASPQTALQVNSNFTSSYGSINITSDADALGGLGFRANSLFRGGLIYRDGTAGSNLELLTNQQEPILFKTNGNNERMRIDSSGNVGIGTSSPSGFSSGAYNLVLSATSGSNCGITINNDGSDTGSIFFANGTSESAKGRIRYDHSNDSLAISTVDTEAMRIDSSGNLLVNATSLNIANTGHGFGAYAYHTRSGEPVLYVNRTTSDGTIIDLRKDNSTVGVINSAAGVYITMGSGDTGFSFNPATDGILPHNPTTNAQRDAAIDLGFSSVRWKDLYLSGGVYLGGTTSANYIEDYEEGTFTPAYGATTSDPTITHDTQLGSYVKIGQMVYFQIFVGTDSKSGGTGDLVVKNLPFTVSSDSAVYIGQNYAFASALGGFAIVSGGTNYIKFYPNNSASEDTHLSLGTGTNANRLNVAGCYLTT